MKYIKWFVITISALLLVIALYLTVFFEPNDFKPQLVEIVKEKTGRDLSISSDLSWTFFPTLGIELNGISLSNPAGFDNESMVEINHLVAEIALIPLFKTEIKIAKINLDGLTLILETQKDGRSSFDGLAEQTAATKTKNISSESTISDLSRLDIDGIAITNTKIIVVDYFLGTEQVFALKNLSLGHFELDKFASLSYEFDANLSDLTVKSIGKGKIKVSQDLQTITIDELAIENQLSGAGIPNNTIEADLITDIVIAMDKKTIKLILSSFTAENINAAGEFDIDYGKKVPSIIAKLDIGDLDLDAILPKAEEAKDIKNKTEASTSAHSIEPDLTAMKLVNLDLEVSVKSVKVANIQTNNWVMKMAMHNGIANMQQLSADLYDGEIVASAKLDARNKLAQYQFNAQVSHVDIHALLLDSVDIDILDGTAKFNVSGNGKSLLPESLKKNLVANGNFEISDGAIHGINIPQMLRNAKAKINGDKTTVNSTEQKTDFTSMTSSFNVTNSLVSTPDLNMTSPLIRLTGSGTANISSQALDYKLITSIVSTLEGQGGNKRDELYGVEVPFIIDGTMSEPEFSLDTKALLGSKIKEETNKLKDSIFKKFGF
ncbi:AsmA family protein [Shewanella sp.]|uniref:AsmA family protein n=1 Tax=Shewanella sp. TaxID=50422 RepID=UPI0025885203|nr:AsmA family protein [Shewanella sp.]MCJ8301436.1 AsmA family protein [Shewanella sp.]